MAEFMERIRTLRGYKLLTCAQLAVTFDKSESAIRMWESGKTKPDADTLIKIAEYFGCTTDYLLGLSDVKNEKTLTDLSDRIKTLTALFSQFSEPSANRLFDNFIIAVNSVLALPSNTDAENSARSLATFLYYYSEMTYQSIKMGNEPVKSQNYWDFLRSFSVCHTELQSHINLLKSLALDLSGQNPELQELIYGASGTERSEYDIAKLIYGITAVADQEATDTKEGD